VFAAVLLSWSASAWAETENLAGVAHFRKQIEPILVDACYDCHGDGEAEGSLALDQFESDDELLADRELWWKVLKNLRAGIMPPKRKTPLTSDQFDQISQWVKADVFGIDVNDPDPGRVTVRRLNRVEYRNTIRDLMGVDFDTTAEFPPDDTGYGFDNIGDVLSISPLLLEKYLQAADSIVTEAVPMAATVLPERIVDGSDFRSVDESTNGSELSFYEQAAVEHRLQVEQTAIYQFVVVLHVKGQFKFDPGRCEATFFIDGKSYAKDEFVYAFSDDPDRGKSFRYTFEQALDAGEHLLKLDVRPLVSKEQRINRLDLSIKSVTLQGPLDPRFWVRPEGYDRFFPDGPAPVDSEGQRRYAKALLGDFALRAFRRPAEPEVIVALASLAESIYSQPGKTFEQGVARAVVAVLASPRFLFRIEGDDEGSLKGRFPFIDEYALASRLSYFFWSTMPDQELFDLASEGRLRETVKEQVARLLHDPRSDALIRNFTGQWLQARNIEHISIEPLAALGLREEYDRLRERYGRRLRSGGDGEVSPELKAARTRYRELREISNRFNRDLRRAMRRETEMVFAYVLHGDRDVLELIDCDYTFLNQRLAEHYGVQGVTGEEMRLVNLPKDSPRGGVLTQGTMLSITSNPTRTSPVKRGLYILENILGTPSPPAPPGVPSLEESAETLEGDEPALREILARHREDALCRSCHARIDPLGLAFENFTALGSWRDEEGGELVDASGKLVSGEAFEGVQDLKTILREQHALSFYRCLTEKLLIYALGRGLDSNDEHTVDVIVERLQAQEGRFSALIDGIIESAPFQKRRSATTADGSDRTTDETRLQQTNES